MPGHKVCVIGAAGGIGQPLSLLLKNNVNVSELSLYDVNPLVNGVRADLSHIETPAKVSILTITITYCYCKRYNHKPNYC